MSGVIIIFIFISMPRGVALRGTVAIGLLGSQRRAAEVVQWPGHKCTPVKLLGWAGARHRTEVRRLGVWGSGAGVRRAAWGCCAQTACCRRRMAMQLGALAGLQAAWDVLQTHHPSRSRSSSSSSERPRLGQGVLNAVWGSATQDAVAKVEWM